MLNTISAKLVFLIKTVGDKLKFKLLFHLNNNRTSKIYDSLLCLITKHQEKHARQKRQSRPNQKSTRLAYLGLSIIRLKTN